MFNEPEHGYDSYLEKWLNGLGSEIHFWDKLLATKGSCLGADAERVFALRCSYDAPFVLENDLEEAETAFLDIGSGPFSNCGIKTDKSRLKFTAIDPLAAAYKIQKEKYGVTSPVAPETGIVELVDELYPEDSFDIVHMSNSLDHCFDPLVGLWKMLYVTKVGGKIILRHNENEAEHARYGGLHQWNIHVTETGRCEIWRPNQTIDVQAALSEYAVVEEARMADTMALENVWHHNRVVLRKVKPIPKTAGIPYGLFMQRLIEQFITLECGRYGGTSL